MILVAGSANLDFVVRANHIPAPGETVLGRDFQTFPGGKGANQAVACARAGAAPTHMLLALGKDAFATPLVASLTQAKVELHKVEVAEQATGTAFICVSESGENAITVAPGANDALRPTDLPPLQGFTHLLLQLETPLDTVHAYAQAAQSAGVCVVLNAAPARALPQALLDCIDVLVVNEGELAVVANHNASVRECLERLAVPTVVVTLGGRGCCARSDGRYYFALAYTVAVQDTTAAGDTFCGAMVAALHSGKDIAQALQTASAAAALTCTRLGAQSSIPEAAEVAQLIDQQSSKDPEALAALRAYCGMADT